MVEAAYHLTMSSYVPLAFVLGISLVAVWHRLQPRKDVKSLELPPGPEGEPSFFCTFPSVGSEVTLEGSERQVLGSYRLTAQTLSELVSAGLPPE